MSADNGIYILGTKKPNTEKEFEFRVVHAQSINNITWAGSPEFDDLNATIVCDYFGRSNIYTLEEARERAFELEEEVLQTMRDLRDNDVDVVTIGQYLQPSSFHVQIKEYVHPKKFEKLKAIGLKMGFMYIAAGPLVRSSYKAGEFFVTSIKGKTRT